MHNHSHMNKTPIKSTRRTFIRRITATIAATSIGIAGWSNFSRKNRQNDLILFSKGQIGSLEIKNRLIRAAASKGNHYSGLPSDDYLNMYASYASGGAGLILTGGMAVASPGEGLIRAYADAYIPEIEKIANMVHSTDESCKIMAQLWHNENAGPSGISWGNSGSIPTLTVDQIKDRISKFSEAIRRVRDAGFDGIELNAHYVYFLSSFLSPITNKRTDDYGGSVEKRVRIVKEIIEQARVNVGDDFPIMIKVNCNDSDDPEAQSEEGTNIDNFHLLAAELEKTGVDAIEMSGIALVRPDITPEEESYFSEYSENLDVSIPIISTGGNRTLDHLEEIIHRDKVDFFGLARPLIREPNLPKRWLEGDGRKSECISCNKCVGAAGPLQCYWTVGIRQNSPSELRIFPNPVKDMLYIELPELLPGEIVVVVSDLNGKEISRTHGNIKQLDLSTYQKGTYLFTIQSGDFEATKQIIKL